MKNLKIIVALAAMAIGLVLLILGFFDVYLFPFQGLVDWVLIIVGGFLGQLAMKEEDVKQANEKISTLSSKQQKKIKKLRNLLYVVYADGNVKKEEVALVISILKDELDSQFNMELIEKEAEVFESRSNFSLYIPESEEEKNTHLAQLVGLMMIDGKESKEERKRIKEIAKAFGYGDAQSDVVIDSILKSLEENEEFLNLRKQLKKL